MSASKGWRTEVKLEGDLTDEEMLHSPAAAGATDFYTRNFPVVDPSTRAVTDDENDVTVKKNGTALNPASDYTLTGATGRIVLASGASDGDVITITYSYTRSIAYGRSGEVTVDGGLEEIHVLGQRTPKEILEGAIKIGGSLERFFVNRDFAGHALPDPDGDVGQTPKTLFLWPLGNTSGKPLYTVGGVKFGPWTLTVPDPDTPITESLSWKGTSITPSVVA